MLDYEARNYPTARTLKRDKMNNNRTKPACFILHVVRSALIIKTMDTKKIQEITRSLESIKSAHFYNPNWAFVGFQTGFTMCTRQDAIRTSPLNDNHSALTKELNEAIKPILEKYAKIFEDELRKCCS